MEDNKLKVKLKISLKDKDQIFQPQIVDPSSADFINGGSKEFSDELEEDEIREDDGDGEVAVTQEGVIDASNKRVCPHCGREFNGGKALGGHLRIHTEPKSKPMGSGSGPGPAQTQDVYPCMLCHKKFRSEKALFGHMRSHPERDYRGMRITGSGSGHKPAPCSARRPFRDGWKVKGRRGQNGCAAKIEAAEEAEAEASSSVSLKEDEWVAADVLCHFAKRTTIIENEYEDGKNNNDGAKMGATMMKKREFDEYELYFLRTYLELKTNSLSDNNNNAPLNSNSIASTSYSKKEAARAKKRAKVIVQSNDVEVGDNDVEEDNRDFLQKSLWECTICNKTFPTHQALGGHKSSHSKLEKERDVGSSDNNGIIISGKEVDFPLYKCKICDQSFASGQALGGHQRSHYVPQSSSLDSSPEHIGRRDDDGGNYPFQIDLNLMAKDDVDGDTNDE